MADPTAQRIWDTALGHLQIHITRPNFDTWLKDTTGVRMENGHFVVGVPSEFVKEWLASRMRGLVSQTLAEILGRPTEVSFEIIGRNGAEPHSGNGSDALSTEELPLAAASPSQAIISSPTIPYRLNPRYTFRSFVVADCNRMAAAAAVAAAENPGQPHNNPLFIYSNPGLGKTHLLQAIAQRAQQLGHNAIYVTSEQFTNEFVTSLSRNRAEEFRRRYRGAQLLLVDDIQFLASKGRTQDEFFYTFNDLHSNGGQVVLASDRAPSAIEGLNDRLCSRFEWGLIADIQPPDKETRLAIVLNKAREHKVTLPEDVSHLLADRCLDNIRELEGCLNRVVAFARLTNAPITLALAQKALAALTPSPITPGDPESIIKAVCAYYNVSHSAITGKSRAKPIAEARHVAMYLLREDADLALKQVGLLLGHRDHSTVIHGVQKVARALLTDPRLAAQLSDIRAKISR